MMTLAHGNHHPTSRLLPWFEEQCIGLLHQAQAKDLAGCARMVMMGSSKLREGLGEAFWEEFNGAIHHQAAYGCP